MPRFFLEDAKGSTLRLIGEDAAHLAGSLRAKAKEEIVVSDGKGTDFICEIISVARTEVVCEVLSTVPCASEPAVKITLYMAMPKSDKAEFIVQKAVELGVEEVVFFLSNRCVSRPDGKSQGKKIARYEKIALEAAKQSGRGIVPKVRGVLSFKEALIDSQSKEQRLFCYEKESKPLREVLNHTQSIAVFVGAEGGFEPYEHELAVESGVKSISLGKRILRCETAPIAVISAIMYASGEF